MGGSALVLLGVVLVMTGGDDTDIVAADQTISTELVTTTQPEPSATSEPPLTSSSLQTTLPEVPETATPEPTPSPEPETTEPPETTEGPVTTEPPSEDPEVFLGLLVNGLRSDAGFLVSRLNQATFDRYGEQQCIDTLPSLLDATAELTLREFGETGPWEYVTDGVSTTIENALRVEVGRIAAGQTLIQELHWTLVDGQWTWFTDCGTPVNAG